MEKRENYFTTINGQQVDVTISKLSRRNKAYKKVIQGFMQLSAGLYELIFDEAAPRPTEVLKG